MRDVRARQRDEYGGLNWGAAFFGWLVAIGVAVILLAILSAAGTAFGLSDNVSTSDAKANADTLGIVGGILLIAVLAIAYYCGGYVSGRMSRFDGGRQGFGTWAIGLIVTIVLAVAGVVFGSKYNVLEQLNLPRIPVDEGTLTTGAAHRARGGGHPRPCSPRWAAARPASATTGRSTGSPTGTSWRASVGHPLHQLTVETDVLAAVGPDLSEAGPERRQVDVL